jgi:hypothetical protein
MKWVQVLFSITVLTPLFSKEFLLSGTVRDMSGQPLSSTSVAMRSGAIIFKNVTSKYGILIPGD